MPSQPSPLLERDDDLYQLFHEAEKPSDAWRIGAEAEKLGLFIESGRAVNYQAEGTCVRWLLSELVNRFGWQPESETEGAPVIALKKDSASVTLEPGSQLELSGAPLKDIHAIDAEAKAHIEELKQICLPVGLTFLGLGFHPIARQADLDWSPKSRYSIMQNYLPTVGQYGLDMMRRTATVQANFDYCNEADAMKKVRVGYKLSPLVTAMFANSPWYEGAPFGGKSYRAKVWLSVDPSRQGIIPAMLSPNSSYGDYIQWALDAPMFLFKRDGKVIANTGQTFRSFYKDGFEGHRATFADWEMHLNTMFPEIRLKRTIEVRGGDSLPTDLAVALAALWTGIMYNDDALDEAQQLTSDFTFEELTQLREKIPFHALQSSWRTSTLAPLANQTVDIAERGLKKRSRLNANGQDESVYLAPLRELVEKGQCAADRYLDKVTKSSDSFVSALIQHTRLF